MLLFFICTIQNGKSGKKSKFKLDNYPRLG